MHRTEGGAGVERIVYNIGMDRAEIGIVLGKKEVAINLYTGDAEVIE